MDCSLSPTVLIKLYMMEQSLIAVTFTLAPVALPGQTFELSFLIPS